MKKFLIVILLVILFVSCSEKKSESLLNVALSQEPPTLDINKNSSLSLRIIMVGNVFEKLFTLDGSGNAQPELCKDFIVSDDARYYEFNLRENVFFHNGTELTSKEAVSSLNRWIESYNQAKKAVSGARFEIIDKYRFKIELENSLLLLPEMLASSSQSAVIMAEESLLSLDEKGFITKYTGTGPYVFESWQLGKDVVLKRYDNYSPYGGAMDGQYGKKNANFDKIIYNFVPDALTRTLGLEKGDYDFINDVMNDDIPRLLKNEKIEIFQGDESGSFVMVFNKRKGLCSNPYMREAINTAIDFDLALSACYGNGGYTLHSNYMEKHQKRWLVEGLEEFYNKNDKQLALKILDENGYDGSKIRILSPNLSNMEKTAIAIKSELEQIGIPVELIITDWATAMSYRTDDEKFDIYLTALSSVPIPSLKLFLDPSYPGWTDDEELKTLFSAFNNATTNEDINRLWHSIHKRSYQYLPAIVLGHYLAGYGWNKMLKGVNTYMGYYFYNAYFSN